MKKRNRWTRFKEWFWTTCWVSGHDWEVIDTYDSYSSSEYSHVQYERKVCLQCQQIVDEITPQLRLEDKLKQRRASRGVQAQRIWDNRHKYF